MIPLHDTVLNIEPFFWEGETSAQYGMECLWEPVQPACARGYHCAT